MALSKNVTKSVYGKELIFDNAYHFIDAINWDKETNTADFTVICYDNKTDKNVLSQSNYKFSPAVESTSDNFIKQAYEYLLVQEEFSDAESVLD